MVRITATDARRATVAPPEEDPNAIVACSSPPCFLHELDASYLGYLGRHEVLALLHDLQMAECAATLLEEAWLHAMLRRHIGHLGSPADRGLRARGGEGSPGPVGPKSPQQDRDQRRSALARRIREALPRLEDETLRSDLEDVAGMLERELDRRAHPPRWNEHRRSWEEVRAWRKMRREMLLARRLAVSRGDRSRWNEAITELLERSLPALGGARIVGFYWPFKGEYDPRPLARSLHGQGIRLALPVVVERASPLAFREWWPGAPMTRGVWDIPIPEEGGRVVPEALLVPLLGFDGRGYRLGYGGGYYDRTLAAAMPDKPLTIGIGYELSRLATIHPQPHDVPMDLIVTERRIVPTMDGDRAMAAAALAVRDAACMGEQEGRKG